MVVFCQHCGKVIGEGSTFCNFCGGRQGTVAAPPPPENLISEDEYADVGEVCEEVNGYELPGGRIVRLHAVVERGGPFELLLFDENDELFKTFGGIVTDSTFELTLPKARSFGFGFQSTGQPGAVRLQIY